MSFYAAAGDRPRRSAHRAPRSGISGRASQWYDLGRGSAEPQHQLTYGDSPVRSPNHPPSKLATACVVALVMLAAATSAPGEQPPERWPGNHLGLNTAIVD